MTGSLTQNGTEKNRLRKRRNNDKKYYFTIKEEVKLIKENLKGSKFSKKAFSKAQLSRFDKDYIGNRG